MHRISFVIPTYNAADTLKAAVDSIFAGNFTEGDEVIIVNDAATDSTQDSINELVTAYHPHIRTIKNEVNKGCPATRNVGIRTTTTELIFNLDADNILAPGSVETLKQALIEQNADIVAFARYHYFVGNTRLLTHIWYCNPGWFTIADLFAGHINPGPGGNFLYTKACWEKVHGYFEYGRGLHEAWGFTLKQLAAGSKLYVVPNTYYFHRHGHESLFVSESKNRADERQLLFQFLTPYQHFFSPTDWDYMHTNEQWYRTLDTRPIGIVGGVPGKNGTMQVLLYGRWFSLGRKIKSFLK